MASQGNDKRVAISVNLSPGSRDVVDSIRQDTGVPNVTVVERLLEWFGRMPRKFRIALLTGDTEGQQEMLIAWFRESMAAHGKAVEISEGDDVYARIRLMKQILDEVEIAYAVERKKTEKPKKKG